MTDSEGIGRPPKTRSIIAYGFLGLPLAFAGLPLYIHIPDFYTRELGLGMASAGFILMALRLIDAIQDPVIGFISDKSAKIQKIVMGTGIIALLIGMGALLSGPPSFIPVAYWFCLSAGLTALGFSMTSINFVMIGSLWSNDQSMRNHTSAVREGFSLIGMLLASILPALLFLSLSKMASFQIVYIVFAILLLTATLAFISFYKGIPKTEYLYKREGLSRRIPLSFIRQNKKFLSACFLTHIAASFPAILFLYFVTDYLGMADKSGGFLFLYFLSGVIFMPLWLKIARHYSNRHAWLMAILVSIVTFVGACGLNPGDTIPFAIICIMSGMALGADLAIPPVMLAQYLNRQTGESYAAQAYAILNLMPKIALALSTGIAFLALNQAGFSPSASNSAQALNMLVVFYALVPCLIKAASGLLVFYLDNGETNDIQKRSITHGHSYGA